MLRKISLTTNDGRKTLEALRVHTLKRTSAINSVAGTYSSDINRKLEFAVTQLFISAHRCILVILISRGSTKQYKFVFIANILTCGVMFVS